MVVCAFWFRCALFISQFFACWLPHVSHPAKINLYECSGGWRHLHVFHFPLGEPVLQPNYLSLSVYRSHIVYIVSVSACVCVGLLALSVFITQPQHGNFNNNNYTKFACRVVFASVFSAASMCTHTEKYSNVYSLASESMRDGMEREGKSDTCTHTHCVWKCVRHARAKIIHVHI